MKRIGLMKKEFNIKSIYDSSFRKYGQVLNCRFDDILERLKKIVVPSNSVIYVASVKELEESSDFEILQKDFFGGQQIQIGYCGGFNKTSSALEYHKSSEINIANEDFVLVLGERKDIVDDKYDLSKVEMFLVPQKTAIEIYATTLHYCPISFDDKTFNMLVVLPKGTNVGHLKSKEEPLLWSNNKWLLVHPDNKQANDGAHIGLIGKKIVLP